MSFDTHQGHKSTIPRRPRSSHGVPRNKKRAATIWGFMDKATQGMAAAHEIIELLEKDNTIFGQYLANEAERERAADEAAAADFGFVAPREGKGERDKAGALPPLAPGGRLFALRA